MVHRKSRDCQPLRYDALHENRLARCTKKTGPLRARRVEQGGFTSGRRGIWEDPVSAEAPMAALYNDASRAVYMFFCMMDMHILHTL